MDTVLFLSSQTVKTQNTSLIHSVVYRNTESRLSVIQTCDRCVCNSTNTLPYGQRPHIFSESKNNTDSILGIANKLLNLNDNAYINEILDEDRMRLLELLDIADVVDPELGILAEVRVAVDVLVVVGDVATEAHEVEGSAAYAYTGNPFDPGEQVPEEPVPLALAIADPLVAWSALDFIFHDDDPDGRGAYLRSLDVDVSADGWGIGSATSYSPGTQLSAFDYRFTGTMSAVDVGGAIERGRVEEVLAVEMDAEGKPLVHARALQ